MHWYPIHPCISIAGPTHGLLLVDSCKQERLLDEVPLPHDTEQTLQFDQLDHSPVRYTMRYHGLDGSPKSTPSRSNLMELNYITTSQYGQPRQKLGDTATTWLVSANTWQVKCFCLLKDLSLSLSLFNPLGKLADRDRAIYFTFRNFFLFF